MAVATDGLDAAIAWLAERQHGVVALAQLVALGVGPRGVQHRAARGALHRVHRGVYAVGHPALTVRGHWMAAVLACGVGAVLSHRSAAALWELWTTARRAVDISAPGRAGRRVLEIDAHCTRTLTPEDVTVVDGIPCTTVARTLLDFADVMPRRAVERAFDQAEVLRLFDLRALEDALGRAGPRRGLRVIRPILAEHAVGETLTRKELEERFLALCRQAGVPQPEVNQSLAIEGEEWNVDFLWRAQPLIVETDSWTFHRTRRAFERDREHDQKLLVAGYRILRFTWRQIVAEPTRVAATLASALNGQPRPQRARAAPA